MSERELGSAIEVDSALRYIVLFSQDGKQLARVDRPGASLLEPADQTAMILERFAIARGMTLGADKFYGETKTIIVRREKLTELVFPLGKQLVLVGADPNFPLEKTLLLEKMLADIRDSKKR